MSTSAILETETTSDTSTQAQVTQVIQKFCQRPGTTPKALGFQLGFNVIIQLTHCNKENQAISSFRGKHIPSIISDACTLYVININHMKSRGHSAI